MDIGIGYAIRREGKKRAVYIIYRGMLDQYKRKVAGERKVGKDGNQP